MIKKVLLAIALICPMLLSAQTIKIGLVDFGSIPVSYKNLTLPTT